MLRYCIAPDHLLMLQVTKNFPDAIKHLLEFWKPKQTHTHAYTLLCSTAHTEAIATHGETSSRLSCTPWHLLLITQDTPALSETGCEPCHLKFPVQKRWASMLHYFILVKASIFSLVITCCPYHPGCGKELFVFFFFLDTLRLSLKISNWGQCFFKK